MKHYLRSGQMADAILSALDAVKQYHENGDASSWERFMEMFSRDVVPILFFVGIIGFVFWNIRRQQREQRVYAQVESQLSQMDRDRAEALQGRYQCTSCPICLEDFQPSDDDDNVQRKGSDGQPLKLLRCGHVFCETCWNEWVTTGQGNVRRCPICQQDVGGDGNNATTRPTGGMHNAFQEDSALTQYYRERNFRLARMGRRYPRYVRPDMIRRWTQSTYDGTLARDDGFVRSNPRYRDASSSRGNFGSNRSSFGGSSFGGGSSSGGRGGRW
eukprot:CAMPEP_0116824804 /NCGR_PEP_ID=MMETSP0418-20121206/1602_1 /TAXON_ID=1158023 /ORGANISM="Astrosyne radiata, Strain 13vi08-1A" /LENGTH=271 /DNA_ID=CAMNT_0004453219 /DNA_START=124 /DNA_END=939 /DNA_ORIENTATION=-